MLKRKKYIWIFIFILIVALTSCGLSANRIHETKENEVQIDEMISKSPENMPETMSAFETSINVLTAIKNRDYQLLSKYAHPEKGIIFSPDSYVDYNEDSVFSAEQIKLFGSDNTIYSWGYFDLSGNLIELTANEYFDKYVYNKEYIYSQQIGINSIVYSGNLVENVAELFPNAIFVDFHDEGTEEFDYIDWSDLKIVLEKYNDILKVIAIINSRTTI